MWDPHPCRVRWRMARTASEAFKDDRYVCALERPAPRARCTRYALITVLLALSAAGGYFLR